MDGVGQVTQCQIGPSSSFSYVYTASPAGTFWYHSHSGAQRTDGFFGGLIVKERPSKMRKLRDTLQRSAFEDLPDQHTLTLLDWQHEASLDLFTQIHASLNFYPGKPLGDYQLQTISCDDITPHVVLKKERLVLSRIFLES